MFMMFDTPRSRFVIVLSLERVDHTLIDYNHPGLDNLSRKNRLNKETKVFDFFPSVGILKVSLSLIFELHTK